MKKCPGAWLPSCIVSVTILFTPHHVMAQSLLLNGNFEEENICTEYKVNCAPEAWLTNDDVFNNYYKDARRAYEGLHFMSVEAGHSRKSFKRTFIRSRLLCPLMQGNRYRLRFFIKSPHPILDSVGILFSEHDLLFDRRPLQTITPAFYLTDVKKDFRKDSSWQQVMFEFEARGQEQYISFGNFSWRDITGNTRIPGEVHFFVYLDAISLEPMSAGEILCKDWQARMEEIYDQDERHEFLRKKIRASVGPVMPPVKSGRINGTRIDTLVLQEVLFESGKADLKKESHELLDRFCQTAYGRIIDSLIIEGHTDNRGSDEMNNLLSQERVQSVLDFLAARAFVKPSRITARAWGESRPIADNNTSEGRRRNRRVVLILYARD